jgi:hypothetical protein
LGRARVPDERENDYAACGMGPATSRRGFEKLVEMDERVNLADQLAQETGPVILFNKFNVSSEDADGPASSLGLHTLSRSMVHLHAASRGVNGSLSS